MVKKSQLYTIYDRIAEDYGPIFEAVNNSVALRQFNNIMQKTEYPDDYKLIHVGEIDFADMTIKQEVYDVVEKDYSNKMEKSFGSALRSVNLEVVSEEDLKSNKFDEVIK